MNKNILHLYKIAQKENRFILGLMSGTSLDGLDIALCNFKGSGMQTEMKLLHFETILYDEDFKNEIKKIFSQKNIDLQKLTLLNAWVGLQHGNMVNNFLQKWNIKKEEVDIIASHGQTIYHAPKSLHGISTFENATLQIGDGDHVAVTTGIITLSDFRQKNIAAGGEGAPLAVYGDYLLFSKAGEDRILLNIGGIANFTFLPGDKNPSNILCTDVGPGNTMMDAYIQKHFKGKYFDENASIALQGKIDEALLETLKNHPFFKKDFPKTTGPELFNLTYLLESQNKSGTNNLSTYDVMATLNKFSADMIVAAITASIKSKNVVLHSSGGGMHNPLLMQHLHALLPGYRFFTTDTLHINPDAKEALLFAILANECVAGGETVIGNGTNDIPSVSMGKISFPW